MEEEKGKTASRLFRALRSLKFTVVCIALLVLLSAISTFIPQNLPQNHYIVRYPAFICWLIFSTGFDNFFSSFGFFVLVLLFFINLCCCTAFRFSRELKKKSKRNFGPDILHGGLILFMIFALISVINRMDGEIPLIIGESVELPNGNVLVLDDFEYLQYENGRPRDWISYLTITDGDEILFDSAPLRVNHPVALDGFSLYQISYGTTADGEDFSVIQAIRDPGFTLVVVSFIIIGLGIFITFIIKLRRTHE